MANNASAQLLCQTSALASLAACNKAKGYPAAPGIYSGSGVPEGTWIGFWPGDQYVNTDTGKQYSFNGTPGTATGWNILN